MKWSEHTISLLWVTMVASAFAACQHGNERPAAPHSHSENLPSEIDGRPPVSKPPDTPAERFEGKPGKASEQEESLEKTPKPSGSSGAP